MKTPTESAERMALRGLLLAIVEAQNIVRDNDYVGDFRVDIAEIVNSDHVREHVQLARALLDTTPNRKVFYGIVTQYDCSEGYRDRIDRARHPCDGPIIFEQYLNDETAVRANLEERAKRRTAYGWVRIAEIHVEIPEVSPKAIPADQASVHT